MKIATDFHVFRSHFFSKLEEFGPNAILSWSNNMNIFERSVIFIPVNESNHWTLLAVVNCGSIISEDKTPRKDARCEEATKKDILSIRIHCLYIPLVVSIISRLAIF